MKHSLQLAMIHELAAILNPFTEIEKKFWLDCQAEDLSFIQFTDKVAAFYSNGDDVEEGMEKRLPPVSFNVRSETKRGEDSSLLVEWCIDLKDRSRTFVYMLIEEFHSLDQPAFLHVHEVSVIKRILQGRMVEGTENVTIYQVEDAGKEDPCHSMDIDAEMSAAIPVAENVLLREAFGTMLTGTRLDRIGSYKFRLIKAVLLADYVEPVETEEGKPGTEAPATEA